jgi:hypothetical protein
MGVGVAGAIASARLRISTGFVILAFRFAVFLGCAVEVFIKKWSTFQIDFGAGFGL